MNRLPRFGASAVSGLLCVISGCDKGPAGPPGHPPSPVTVASAVTRDVPIYLDEIGHCSARESVTITPQVAGQITQIHFVEGSSIHKGDPLVTIDPRPYQAQLAQVQASVLQAQSASDFAHSDWNRVEGLLGTKAVSQQDYDTKKNAYAVAQAQVKVAQAALQTANLNLDYCYIRSPIDGRTGQRLIDMGNVVKANEGSLVIVQRLDPIYADFTVTEGELARVREEMSHGTLRTLVRLPEEPMSAARDGSLVFLDNAVQDGSGTVKLRAVLKNTDFHFWPGQFMKIRLVLSIKKDAVLVPAVAEEVGQAGAYVLVVKSDNTAEQRPVKVGQRQGNWLVVDGVKAGEKVITDGQLLVMPGLPVNVLSDSSTRPAVAPDVVAAGASQEGGPPPESAIANVEPTTDPAIEASSTIEAVPAPPNTALPPRPSSLPSTNPRDALLTPELPTTQSLIKAEPPASPSTRPSGADTGAFRSIHVPSTEPATQPGGALNPAPGRGGAQ